MWPPSSPDLNLMDCSVWSYLEKEVCSTPPTSIDNLKKKLIKVWEKIPQNMLHAIDGNVAERLKAVIKEWWTF